MTNRTRWEYLVIALHDVLNGKEAALNFWGVEGWELVNVAVERERRGGNVPLVYAYLKRPATVPDEDQERKG